MWPDILRALLQRLDCEPPLFFAEEVEQRFGEALDVLLRLGLLREVTPTNVSSCGDCGSGQVRRVVFVPNPQTGQQQGYVSCPECGVVKVELDRLRRWAVDAAALLTAVAKAAGVLGPASEVLAGRLWRVGKVNWADRPREVYFACFVDAESRPTLAAVMTHRPKAVLFVPTEETVRHWGSVTPNLVLALESVVSLGPNDFTFDRAFIESRLTDAGLTAAPRARPAKQKRASRAGKIERLRKELVRHLVAARDHAKATMDGTGAPKLLPRPTQKVLAKLAGISETDVSRCLQDPQAQELRLLWDAAADLDTILSWSGSVRAGDDD
jgi:hypothetical protein